MRSSTGRKTTTGGGQKYQYLSKISSAGPFFYARRLMHTPKKLATADNEQQIAPERYDRVKTARPIPQGSIGLYFDPRAGRTIRCLDQGPRTTRPRRDPPNTGQNGETQNPPRRHQRWNVSAFPLERKSRRPEDIHICAQTANHVSL